MGKLASREEQILQAIVHHYVDTIEPVSSKTLVQRFGLNASSATVRSTMGALEQRGLLTQPHSSSGRIPSPQGYRHYVNCLLPPPATTVQHLERELTNLTLRWSSALDDLLWDFSRRLTDFTGLMSLITKPTRQTSALQEIRLVKSGERLLVMLVKNSNQASHLNLRLPPKAETELEAIEAWTRKQLADSGDGSLDWNSLPSQLHQSGFLLREAIASHNKALIQHEKHAVFHGISRLLLQPEFRDGKRIKSFLELLDSNPSSVAPSTTNHIGRIWIGAEHPEKALKNCSVVQASYSSSGNEVGQVALIGPMRMTYSTARAAVKGVAKHLTRLLS